jgi:tripartite-type tricarboxylate transporter receptor subunit TctC
MIVGFRMMREFRRILTSVLLPLLAVVGLSPFVPAKAAWPERTITIIVQFAPGGSNDLLGRILAAELAPVLGQNVIVENRPGAGGNIGALAGARAAPDGYTLAVLSGPILIQPNLGKVAYDPLKDFAPVAYLGASPNVILTRPNSGIATVAELLARAKAEPGKINYATPGTGSVSHLSVEFLKLRAGIDIVHVPFSGAAPAAQAAIAGTTEIASVNIPGMLGHVQSGALRALVQTGGTRWPEMADVPTLVEAGIKDAVLETTQFLLAPAGTPQPIVDRLADETLKALRKPQVRERMMNASFAVSGEGPQQLRVRMENEFAAWKEVIDKAGLRTN